MNMAEYYLWLKAQRMSVGKWRIDAVEDNTGRLRIIVTHEDNAPIFVDTSSGYEEPNAELGCTFRTEGYAKES
jgi:hypothetical protein